MRWHLYLVCYDGIRCTPYREWWLLGVLAAIILSKPFNRYLVRSHGPQVLHGVRQAAH